MASPVKDAIQKLSNNGFSTVVDRQKSSIVAEDVRCYIGAGLRT